MLSCALTAALRVHEKATVEHAERTRALAGKIAEDLGLEDISRICHVALLHDVGKLGIPRSILHMSSGLSESEWRVVRRHPALGADLLRSVAGFEPVRAAILAHHERFDG